MALGALDRLSKGWHGGLTLVADLYLGGMSAMIVFTQPSTDGVLVCMVCCLCPARGTPDTLGLSLSTPVSHKFRHVVILLNSDGSEHRGDS